MPVTKKVSDVPADLIKRLLVKENDRASLAEIEAHPWLQQTEFPDPRLDESLSEVDESSDD